MTSEELRPDEHAPEEPVQTGLRELQVPPQCLHFRPDDEALEWDHAWVPDAWTLRETEQGGGVREMTRYTFRWRCARCLIAVSGQSAEDVIETRYDRAVAEKFGMIP